MRLREAMLANLGATTSRKHFSLDNKKCVFIRKWSTHCLYFLQTTGTERIESYTIPLAFKMFCQL